MRTQSLLVAATLFIHEMGVASAQNEPSQDTMRVMSLHAQSSLGTYLLRNLGSFP
jgi:hypothetical protein